MEIKETWKSKGFIDEPIDDNIELRTEIRRMAKEKKAIILAHYYTDGALQEIADFVGDSLALAQKAAKTDADIIVMCGVHFMGETCKLLCPSKKVICPDVNATCSLAESCPADKFADFVKAHPGYKVISYVNTTAATKAVTDIVVTSSNARQIVDSFPKDEKIIFGPDRNLGGYINRMTGRNMLLWNGACHVHDRFSLNALRDLKSKYPDAKVLLHPECREELAREADLVGSTAAIIKYAINSDAKEFIIVTEDGILHEMQHQAPNKVFIQVPMEENGRKCICNECEYMKMFTMEKLYNSLKYEWPIVTVDPAISERAKLPIDRMLEVSAKLGL